MGRKGIKHISKNRIFSRDTLLKPHTGNLMGIYIDKQQSQIGLGLDTATVKEILSKADKNDSGLQETQCFERIFRKSGR